MVYKAKIPLAKCFGKTRCAPCRGQEGDSRGERAYLGGSAIPSTVIDPEGGKGVLKPKNNEGPSCCLQSHPLPVVWCILQLFLGFATGVFVN